MAISVDLNIKDGSVTVAGIDMDPTPGKAAADVARASVEAIEGSMNGETIDQK